MANAEYDRLLAELRKIYVEATPGQRYFDRAPAHRESGAWTERPRGLRLSRRRTRQGRGGLGRSIGKERALWPTLPIERAAPQPSAGRRSCQT